MNTKIVNQAAIDEGNVLNREVMNALAIDNYGKAEALATMRDGLYARGYGITLEQLPDLRRAQLTQYRTAFARR